MISFIFSNCVYEVVMMKLLISQIEENCAKKWQ